MEKKRGLKVKIRMFDRFLFFNFREKQKRNWK